MKVLVTGAQGFIGKHMVVHLSREGHEIFQYDINSTEEELVKYVKECDFIVHLAGVNRPLTVEEFYSGNTNFTKHLVDVIKENNKIVPIIMSSSVKASEDSDYGKSKLMAESFLLSSGLPVYVYRLNNVFGKWGRPNYNSASATFCYNIAHDLPISIRDRNFMVLYNYIDDICDEFIRVINSEFHLGSEKILYVSPTYECSLGRLADTLYYFKKEIESERHLPEIHNEFELKLFKTFCDYLSDEGMSFNFAKDNRGYFEEVYKSKKWGQISDNVSFPGICKGGHYHTYKKEIFYTIIGTCLIKQFNPETKEEIVDEVGENNNRQVKINVGYVHEITNIGDKDSHTIMWISEIYNPNTHDTYRLEENK